MSSIISKLINLAGNITGILPVVNGGTGVSTSTGTVNVVLSNSPTLVTPILGTPASGNLSNCTSYPNVTQSVAGLVVSAGALLGTNTNGTASAGNVGEIISSTILRANRTSVTSGTAKNVTSISLTAGDWDVWGSIGVNGGAGTTISQNFSWISQTSATLPEFSSAFAYCSGSSAGIASGDDFVISIPMISYQLSSTTTVYLSQQVSFAVSTLSGYGSIFARRRR